LDHFSGIRRPGAREVLKDFYQKKQGRSKEKDEDSSRKLLEERKNNLYHAGIRTLKI
jgi:hypothetical protein